MLVSVDGQNIVIDTGPDFRYQMLRAGVEDIQAVLYTHEHKDHVAGLDDIRPFNYLKKHAIDIYATLQVQQALRREFHYIFADEAYPGLPQITLHTISPSEDFSVGKTKVRPVEVKHYKLPVLGFRIGDFNYITDAKTIAPAEMDKIRGSQVLVLNALRQQEHISHLNLSEALALVEELKPRQAYFTHLSHLMGTHAEISAKLPENVALAYDCLSVEL